MEESLNRKTNDIKSGIVAKILKYIQKKLMPQYSYYKEVYIQFLTIVSFYKIEQQVIIMPKSNRIRNLKLIIVQNIKIIIHIQMKKEISAILLAFLAVFVLLNNLKFKQAQIQHDFDLWKKQYGVQFHPSQEAYRLLVFKLNLEIIKNHNSDISQTYKMGVNQFTIYTQDQFKSIFLGQISKSQITKDQDIQNNYNPSNIEIDWTTKGAVSRVKNQGSCGSCWAFASVASCQSWALLQKKSADLSEQQLVDCSGSYGNHGCDGGSRLSALKYIKDHGITSQTSYPYKGVTQACKKKDGQFHINTVSEVSGCSGIQNGLQGRPIAVAVDAGGWSHYSSGIFSNCGKSINHAVLLVGVVNGAWKIKNSWGASWGQKGFIRLASGDTCGICQQAGVYPH